METNQKVCVVTGASSGIGFALAKRLSEENFKVIATARRKERLNDIGEIEIISGDLNSREVQDELEHVVFEKFRTCDFLFNCAGVMEAGSIDDMDIDRMSNMLRLNIESTFRLTYKVMDMLSTFPVSLGLKYAQQLVRMLPQSMLWKPFRKHLEWS